MTGRAHYVKLHFFLSFSKLNPQPEIDYPVTNEHGEETVLLKFPSKKDAIEAVKSLAGTKIKGEQKNKRFYGVGYGRWSSYFNKLWYICVL